MLGIFASSCKNDKQHNSPSFYYWKTVYELSPMEKITLSHLKVEKLYLRLFDVVWDAEKQQASPEGLLKVNDDLSRFAIVPVVYINNEVFIELPDDKISQFAYLVHQQLKEMAVNRNFTFTEYQLDCDWTQSTQKSYFKFLKALKQLDKQWLQTATIRLHQIKYKNKTGVPPVDEGVLMFYNMGEINAKPYNNSIFNAKDANKYSRFIAQYPLPLSAALPIYSWGIHCRAGKVKNILPRRQFIDFLDEEYFMIDTPFVRVTKTTVYKGIAFDQNDYIKIEAVTPAMCLEAASILDKNAPKDGYRNIIFYDLDEHTINRFPHEKITDIYDLLP